MLCPKRKRLRPAGFLFTDEILRDPYPTYRRFLASRTAVEELLRFESSVQFAGRVAKEEIEICGLRVRAGESILFMLGAANRDPCQFKDPDRLNLKRLNNPHLAFGAGAHFCIGNQLARLAGHVAILKMVQQFPRMRLATQSPEWAPNYGLRGLKALPVIV